MILLSFAVEKQYLNQSYILKKVLLNSFFFRKNELNVNESKTEFIIFGAPKRNKIEEIVVNGCTVLENKVVKYLGVHIDCNLSFDEEIKNVLRKMAVGIKVIYSIKNIFPEKTRSA